MRRLINVLALLLFASAPAWSQASADAEVAFTYGVRACNRGEWDEAVRLLREAQAADPEDETIRAWLELALARQRGGTVAAPGFDGLLALRDQPRFDFRAGATYGRDSNPALLPDDVVATGAGIGTLVGEVDDEVADLDLSAAVYPLYGRGGWSLGFAGEVKAARHQELDALDERQWRAAVHLAWGSDPLGYVTGPLGYTRVPFGHSRVSFLLQAGRTDTRVENPLMTADQLALSAVFRETAATATQIELDFQKQDLLDGLLDSDVWSASISQLFFLGRRDRYARIGVARQETTDGFPIGDATALTGTAELALPLADRLTLQLAGSRRKDDFEGLVLGNFEDTTTRTAASLSWQVVPRLYVVGRAGWAERSSTHEAGTNLAPLAHRDYNRTTASLGFQWIW
jgi:hypothetical protein